MGDTFNTLESIFTMTTPSDLIGGVDISLGSTPAVQNQNVFSQLLAVLENNGRGVYTASDLVTQLNNITALPNAQPAGADLSTYLDFYSTQGFVTSLGKNVAASQTYAGPDGSAKQIANIYEIIGADFAAPTTTNPFDVSIILSKSPFFSPATRNCQQATVFLNSMPSIVLSSLVPFLQVEFQFTRSPSTLLQAPGMLKFLLGAVDMTQAGDPNNAMITAHQIAASSGDASGDQLDFAGMEMFTAPQTLVNPQPNLNVSANGTRYVDVIDPFRPFGSIEHIVIKAVPMGKAEHIYKTATLTIKIHDRSRLTEISDFIRPQVYTGVTVWVTYGWRAPNRPGDNPYFDYINNTMLMREAYSVINSNFTFDNVGQVTLTLELSTTGVNEIRQSKISDNANDLSYQFKQLKDLGEKIAQYRQALKLDSPQGLSKEIRAFQLIDAAEAQPIPTNLPSTQDINTAVTTLTQAMRNTSGIDATSLSNLITTLQQFSSQGFTSDNPVAGKFNLLETYATRTTATIAAMFNEVLTGADPFLPTAVKPNSSDPTFPSALAKICDTFNAPPVQPVIKTAKKNVASFGKLFTVFAVRNLISANTTDELQVFFYPLNTSCGPVSGVSIASFPIDMNMFVDQYSDYVKRNGGEHITLDEFMQLVINAQFLDQRALGYGMKSEYKPFNIKNPDAALKDRQATNASQLDAWQKVYGTVFNQPTIEMYVEVSHQKVSAVGYNDVLQYLNYSAADASTLSPSDLQGNASKRIMRIHVYDKQVSPYKEEATLLKRDDGAGFISLPSTTAAQQFQADAAGLANGNVAAAIQAQVQYDVTTGKASLVNMTSNQQVKDTLSKTVPVIRFGSNGTTIKTAHLASMVDPKLASAHMTRAATSKNDASPNGSGENGIPLWVIPAQLQLTTLGNPLATMAQNYFVDFQTGTTLDNIYIVTGLTHTIGQGKFETAWELAYQDAYPVFEGAQNVMNFVQQYPSTIPGAPAP